MTNVWSVDRKYHYNANAKQVQIALSYEEKKEIWLSTMTKKPIPTENSKTKGLHKNATKTSITQRLRTDLGRSVGETTVIKLVWFTGEDAYSSGHLVLSHLGLAFVLMLSPFFPELHTTDLLSFEHLSVLLFCLTVLRVPNLTTYRKICVIKTLIDSIVSYHGSGLGIIFRDLKWKKKMYIF